MNEQPNTPSAASLEAIEAVVLTMLKELNHGDGRKPSPEAERIAARLIARKAYRVQQEANAAMHKASK